MKPSPNRLLVFEEANPESICQPFFGMYMDQGSRSRFYHLPAAYHDRSGVFGYADGHVDPHRWTDKRTYAPGLTNYHLHNDPSPGNADLLWMQNLTTIALPKAPPTNNIVTNTP
jgi:prepilin-type processing-associated H-X9-DG protein